MARFCHDRSASAVQWWRVKRSRLEPVTMELKWSCLAHCERTQQDAFRINEYMNAYLRENSTRGRKWRKESLATSAYQQWCHREKCRLKGKLWVHCMLGITRRNIENRDSWHYPPSKTDLLGCHRIEQKIWSLWVVRSLKTGRNWPRYERGDEKMKKIGSVGTTCQKG